MFIEIMVETIDRSDMTEKIVGFAYFPLFMMPDGKQTPINSNVLEYVFHEGAYQIPIYYERVAEGKEITMQNIIQLPKILCATLLIRAYPCPRGKDGRNLSIDND